MPKDCDDIKDALKKIRANQGKFAKYVIPDKPCCHNQGDSCVCDPYCKKWHSYYREPRTFKSKQAKHIALTGKPLANNSNDKFKTIRAAKKAGSATARELKELKEENARVRKA